MNQDSRIGIEKLCVFDMPPVQFVELAADLGASWIGITLQPMRGYNPYNFPDWSLFDDAALRREFIAAAADRGIGISLVEGFGLLRGVDPRDYERHLELAAELGGHRINVVSSGRDLMRSADGFATLAEMAAPLDIEVCIELGSGPVQTLDAAVTAAEHVGRPNFKVLLDTMHFFRFGNTIERLAQLDPSLIGYVQLADVPWTSSFDTYMEEALYERLAPGEGELPLVEFMRLIPPHIVVSPEIPQRSRVEAGAGLHEIVGHILDRTRDVLREAESS